MAQRSTWTPARDAVLLQMHGEGRSFRQIAGELGISYVAVAKRLAKLQQPAAPSPEPVIHRSGDHVRDYQSARRGFRVPRHLESEYFELLKQGVSIDEARQRLGIPLNDAKGG